MLTTNQIFLIFMSDQNFLIGLNGKQPYYIKEDLQHFQKITKNSIVVMGRKTYEDIIRVSGKPLKNRINLVLTKDLNYVPKGIDPTEKTTIVVPMHSKGDILEFCSTFQLPVFIIGGVEIFSQFEDLALTIYHTKVHDKVLTNEGDNCAFFKPDLSRFIKQANSKVKSFEHNGKSIKYEHRLYVRFK